LQTTQLPDFRPANAMWAGPAWSEAKGSWRRRVLPLASEALPFSGGFASGRRLQAYTRIPSAALPLGTPENLGNHVEADSRRWSDVIRKAGIKLQ
jgi:hypothetical protein